MDKRLIERTEEYTEGLNLVLEMRPYTFHQKGKAVKQIGLISQEIQALEPKTVINTNSGLVINYDSIIPILINAIHDLSKEVQELKITSSKKKMK